MKSTMRKMFGEIGGDGYDACNHSQKRMDINLAFIKRKLDQEISDNSKKILLKTANPTPKTNLRGGGGSQSVHASQQFLH